MVIKTKKKYSKLNKKNSNKGIKYLLKGGVGTEPVTELRTEPVTENNPDNEDYSDIDQQNIYNYKGQNYYKYIDIIEILAHSKDTLTTFVKSWNEYLSNSNKEFEFKDYLKTIKFYDIFKNSNDKENNLKVTIEAIIKICKYKVKKFKIIDYILEFLCKTPKKDNDDFSIDGSRCKRFLEILEKTDFKNLQSTTYIDQFGENYGNILYNYIRDTYNARSDEFNDFIDKIKQKCNEKICDSDRKPALTNSSKLVAARKAAQELKKEKQEQAIQEQQIIENKKEQFKKIIDFLFDNGSSNLKKFNAFYDLIHKKEKLSETNVKAKLPDIPIPTDILNYITNLTEHQSQYLIKSASKQFLINFLLNTELKAFVNYYYNKNLNKNKTRNTSNIKSRLERFKVLVELKIANEIQKNGNSENIFKFELKNNFRLYGEQIYWFTQKFNNDELNKIIEECEKKEANGNTFSPTTSNVPPNVTPKDNGYITVNTNSNESETETQKKQMSELDIIKFLTDINDIYYMSNINKFEQFKNINANTWDTFKTNFGETGKSIYNYLMFSGENVKLNTGNSEHNIKTKITDIVKICEIINQIIQKFIKDKNLFIKFLKYIGYNILISNSNDNITKNYKNPILILNGDKDFSSLYELFGKFNSLQPYLQYIIIQCRIYFDSEMTKIRAKLRDKKYTINNILTPTDKKITKKNDKIMQIKQRYNEETRIIETAGENDSMNDFVKNLEKYIKQYKNDESNGNESKTEEQEEKNTVVVNSLQNESSNESNTNTSLIRNQNTLSVYPNNIYEELGPNVSQPSTVTGTSTGYEKKPELYASMNNISLIERFKMMLGKQQKCPEFIELYNENNINKDSITKLLSNNTKNTNKNNKNKKNNTKKTNNINIDIDELIIELNSEINKKNIFDFCKSQYNENGLPIAPALKKQRAPAPPAQLVYSNAQNKEYNLKDMCINDTFINKNPNVIVIKNGNFGETATDSDVQHLYKLSKLCEKYTTAEEKEKITVIISEHDYDLPRAPATATAPAQATAPATAPATTEPTTTIQPAPPPVYSTVNKTKVNLQKMCTMPKFNNNPLVEIIENKNIVENAIYLNLKTQFRLNELCKKYTDEEKGNITVKISENVYDLPKQQNIRNPGASYEPVYENLEDVMTAQNNKPIPETIRLCRANILELNKKIAKNKQQITDLNKSAKNINKKNYTKKKSDLNNEETLLQQTLVNISKKCSQLEEQYNQNPNKTTYTAVQFPESPYASVNILGPDTSNSTTYAKIASGPTQALQRALQNQSRPPRRNSVRSENNIQSNQPVKNKKAPLNNLNLDALIANVESEVEEAKKQKLSEKKRIDEEAEQKRLATEAEAKKLDNQAEQKRLANEAEKERLAEEADKRPENRTEYRKHIKRIKAERNLAGRQARTTAQEQIQREQNEAKSKPEVKNVIKEELIKYLSDIKGSVINGKNWCERYDNIIKSTDKSEQNFAGKFHKNYKSNLSTKTNYLNNDELNDVVSQCKAKRDININQIKDYLINYLSDSAGSRQNGLNRLQRYKTIFINGKIRDKNEYIKSFNHQDVDNIYMATSRLSNDEIEDVIKKSEANKAKIQPNNEEYLRKRSEYNNYLAKLRENEKKLEKKYINLEEIKRNINDYQNIKLNLNTRPKTKRTKRTKKNNKKFIQNKKSFYNTYETNISEFKSKQTNLEKQIKDLEEKIISERKRLKKMAISIEKIQIHH